MTLLFTIFNIVGLLLQILGILITLYAVKQIIFPSHQVFDDNILDSNIFDTAHRTEHQPMDPETNEKISEISIPNRKMLFEAIIIIIIGLSFQIVATVYDI